MPKEVKKLDLNAYAFAAHMSGNKLMTNWTSDISSSDIIELIPTAYQGKKPDDYTPFDRLCRARDRMKEKLPPDNNLLVLLNQLIAHAEDMSKSEHRSLSGYNNYWKDKSKELIQIVGSMNQEIVALFPENDLQKQKETARLLNSELPTLMNLLSISPPPPVLEYSNSAMLTQWKNELVNAQPNDSNTPNRIMHILVTGGYYDYFVPRFELRGNERTAFEQTFLMARLEANDAARRFAADPIARETYLYKPSCFQAYIEKSLELDKTLSPLRKAVADARQTAEENSARRVHDEKMELLRSLLTQDKTISLTADWNAPEQQIKGSQEYQTMMKNALKLYQQYKEGRGVPTAEESAELVQSCITYTKGKKSRRFFASGRERFTRCHNLAAAFAGDVTDQKIRTDIDNWVKRINEVRGVTEKKNDELYFNINAYGTHGAKPGAAKASTLLNDLDGVAAADQEAYRELVRELATRKGFAEGSEAVYDPDAMLDKATVLQELAARKRDQEQIDKAQKPLTEKENELQPQRDNFVKDFKQLEYKNEVTKYNDAVRSCVSKMENKVAEEEKFVTAMKEDKLAQEKLFQMVEEEDRKYKQALEDRKAREKEIEYAKHEASFARGKFKAELAEQEAWMDKTAMTSVIEPPITKCDSIAPQSRKEDFDAILKMDGVPDGNPHFQKLVEHAKTIWSKTEQKVADKDMAEDKEALIEAAKNVLFDPAYHKDGRLTAAGKQALGILGATLGVKDVAVQKVYIGAMQVAGNVFENVREHGELFADLNEACNPRNKYYPNYLIGTKFSSSYTDLNDRFLLEDADIALKEAQKVCISRYQAAKKAGNEAEMEKFRKAVHTCVITRTAHHLSPYTASRIDPAHIKALREDPKLPEMADGLLDGNSVETKLVDIGKYGVEKLLRKEVTIPEPLSDNGHPGTEVTPKDYFKLLEDRVKTCEKKLNDPNATRKEKIQATHLINHCTLTRTVIELRFADKKENDGFSKKELEEIKTRVTDICKDYQESFARADPAAAKNSIGKMVLDHFQRAVYPDYDGTRPYHGTFHSSHGGVYVGDGEEYYPSHYEGMKKPPEYLNAPMLSEVKQAFPPPRKMFTAEQGQRELEKQGIFPPKPPAAEPEQVSKGGAPVAGAEKQKTNEEKTKENAPVLG